MNKIDLKHLAGYEEDFALWSAEQAALIRAGRFDRVDLENVAEEIESLAKSQRHEIRSRIIVLLQHLLKWEFQPSHRSNSCWSTIIRQRDAIKVLIEESPSLRPHPQSGLTKAYDVARASAVGDTNLSAETFPAKWPYTVEQMLDLAFWPGGSDFPKPSKVRRKT